MRAKCVGLLSILISLVVNSIILYRGIGSKKKENFNWKGEFSLPKSTVMTLTSRAPTSVGMLQCMGKVVRKCLEDCMHWHFRGPKFHVTNFYFVISCFRKLHLVKNSLHGRQCPTNKRKLETFCSTRSGLLKVW